MLANTAIEQLAAPDVELLPCPTQTTPLVEPHLYKLILETVDQMVQARSTPKETVEINSPQTVPELIAWVEAHPIKELVPDIIIEESVHLLHGLEASFKSMFMLQLHEALTCGGEFLGWKVQGGLRTGIAQLEMPRGPFGSRVKNFFHTDRPEIEILPDELRRKVLNGKMPVERIAVLVDWAQSKRLQFLSIDSMAKLFPPGHDTNRQDNASEVFNQLQLLPTYMVLAHDRKPSYDAKATDSGNAEIVGSGRMSQDPDMVFQMSRPDKRMPMVLFSWGKVREGDMPDPLQLYFDKVAFRLYPIHPFIHLLPATRTELLVEVERRYGWKQRTVDEHIAKLKELRLPDGNLAVREELAGHTKRLVLLGSPATLQQNPD